MTMQRTSAEIQILKHGNVPDSYAVTLTVMVTGQVKDRDDALLMIGDAWAHACSQRNIDPVASIQRIKNEGNLN